MKQKIRFFLAFALIFCSLLTFSDITSAAVVKKPKLNIKKLEMTLGNNFSLRVYNLKKKYKVFYTSADSNIATVETEANIKRRAIITAQGIGTTNINVLVKKGKKTIRKLKCKVEVSPSGVSIKFLKRKVNLTIGTRFKSTPIIKPNSSTEQPIYESSNPQVATVSSRGVITALESGYTQITATLLSTGQKAVCSVFVTSEPKSSTKPTAKPNFPKDTFSDFNSIE